MRVSAMILQGLVCRACSKSPALQYSMAFLLE